MANVQKTPKQYELMLQLLCNFILPIFVLTRLSGQAQLGPVWGLLVALMFPILYELISIFRRKKINKTSLIVIGGILVTGAFGLLKVEEQWLALRRAFPYFIVCLVIFVSYFIKRPIMEKALEQMIDIKKVAVAGKKRGVQLEIKKLYNLVSWFAGSLSLAIAVATYIATRIVITSEPLTPEFNQELATLRLYSIGIATVPFLLGGVGIILYVFLKLEKLTGLSTEEITKVK